MLLSLDLAAVAAAHPTLGDTPTQGRAYHAWSGSQNLSQQVPMSFLFPLHPFH